MRKPYRNVMTDKGPMLIAYPCAVIQVNAHHVIFSGEPNDDLANAYRRATRRVSAVTPTTPTAQTVLVWDFSVTWANTATIAPTKTRTWRRTSAECGS